MSRKLGVLAKKVIDSVMIKTYTQRYCAKNFEEEERNEKKSNV